MGFGEIGKKWVLGCRPGEGQPTYCMAFTHPFIKYIQRLALHRVSWAHSPDLFMSGYEICPPSTFRAFQPFREGQ